MTFSLPRKRSTTEPRRRLLSVRCWEQDSNLRSPFGRRFYRPLQLTTLPSQPFDILGVNWSREWDSNPRPIVYKTIALPLSYLGNFAFQFYLNSENSSINCTGPLDRERLSSFPGMVQVNIFFGCFVTKFLMETPGIVFGVKNSTVPVNLIKPGQ